MAVSAIHTREEHISPSAIVVLDPRYFQVFTHTHQRKHTPRAAITCARDSAARGHRGRPNRALLSILDIARVNGTFRCSFRRRSPRSASRHRAAGRRQAPATVAPSSGTRCRRRRRRRSWHRSRRAAQRAAAAPPWPCRRPPPGGGGGGLLSLSLSAFRCAWARSNCALTFRSDIHALLPRSSGRP